MKYFCKCGIYRNWQSRKSWRFRWRKTHVYFLIQIILLIIPIIAAKEYNYDSYGSYDYYGDYDPIQEDKNYVELGANSNGDYGLPNEKLARSKKDTVQESNLQDIDAVSVNNGHNPDCVPPKPPPETATVCPPVEARTEHTTTECLPIEITTPQCEPEEETTPQCETGEPITTSPVGCAPFDADEKAVELRNLIQHLYISQARVQLEASEIKKAQAIANEAQQQLEESANHVRAVTAALQNAQREVATSAIRAQTAQLQLAAHDQLLFAARQDVDALSSRMVGLQAAEGIAQPKYNFDVGYLMNRLHQPLASPNKPKPIPSIALPRPKPASVEKPSEIAYYDYEYEDY